ncbi:MAG: Nif3-like dinuclear metal center hexameric protein [Phycisphaerales bacterium]|nr:Nif3-like dinuclear metal center hexameric protein [Phycisphaerales bacterium]
MATVQDLFRTIDQLAPFRHAASWDNAGLLVGRSASKCTKALLCIDLTEPVLQEAIEQGAEAIIAYHPVVFEARKRVTDLDSSGRLLMSLIEAGIAVISPHTALDAAPEGMTHWLARGMGDGQLQPIEPSTELPKGEAVKLITYAPRDAVMGIRDAVAQAGAGRIGEYDMCSTSVESVGTFRPGEGSDPTIGTHGELEFIEECRLMLPCSSEALTGAIAALRSAHPYEEPPVHVVALSPRPCSDSGQGRLLTLRAPATTDELVERVRAHLLVSSLRVADGGAAEHSTVACCPGAGGSMWSLACDQGASVFLTGEMRYHDVLAAKERGMTVVLAGHTNTERGYLPVFQGRLQSLMPEISVSVSQVDRCPWADH